MRHWAPSVEYAGSRFELEPEDLEYISEALQRSHRSPFVEGVERERVDELIRIFNKLAERKP